MLTCEMKIHFAPLQGYTDAAYRRFHNEIYGGRIDCYYTPFIRVEKGEVRTRDLKDICPDNNPDINLIPQIMVNGVSEFDYLVERVVDFGYKSIDINMGCPFPLQTKRGRGAGLLPRHDAVKDILAAIDRKSDISFSVKMRLGMTDEKECIDLLPLFNDVPLRHITVHPRIASQQYKGDLNFPAFDSIYQMSTHDIVFNGDIITIEHIKEINRRYETLAGVMIGRGLLARPSLALEYTNGEELPEFQRLSMLRELHDKLCAHYESVLQGESQLLMKMKTFWDYLEPAIGHKAWKLIRKSSSLQKYKISVASVGDNQP